MKNIFKKLFGYKYSICDKNSDHKFKWGDFYFHPQIKKWKLGFEFCESFNDHSNKSLLIINPLICSFYIDIPYYRKHKKESFGREWAYGFYLFGDTKWETLVLEWNNKSLHLYFPFINWNHEKIEYLDFNRKVLFEENSNRKIKEDNYEKIQKISKESSKTFDYTYVTKRGQIQDRKATVNVERWTWGRKWFSWSKLIKTSIDISFNEEVGEKCGSWKGGCVGCSWDLQDNETPEQALKRMQLERKFT